MFSGGYHKSLVLLMYFNIYMKIYNILCFPKLVKVIAIFDILYLVK